MSASTLREPTAVTVYPSSWATGTALVHERCEQCTTFRSPLVTSW